MGKIQLLDCTLRDGGYINDWNFGLDAIKDITQKMVSTGVNIVEIGFLKDEPYNTDRTVFNAMSQISDVILPKKNDMQYAAMIEVVNPLPLEKLTPRSDDSVEIIRVVVWKKFLREGFEYCKGIVEKGYKLCVHPARVDQYSYEEFVEMIDLFSTLNPYAIYVVDSFGSQDKKNLFQYLDLADRHLREDTRLGYHGHNNLQQAFATTEALLEQNLARDLIIDASVYGIGRGAGNLNLELLVKYMNERHGTSYDYAPMLSIYDLYLSKIYSETPWGYSFAYYLAALHGCNPNYVDFYVYQHGVTKTELNTIFSKLTEEAKIIFSKETAMRYLNELTS